MRRLLKVLLGVLAALVVLLILNAVVLDHQTKSAEVTIDGAKILSLPGGDLNSDTKTEVQPGDAQAYQVVRKAGFVERSTRHPLSCCINDPFLVGGTIADFNHQVDHFMTDTPKKVKLKSAKVVGRAQVNGLWPSDHAGIVSVLNLK